MKKVRKLLIVSVSAGAGHVRAAEAVKAQAKLQYPDMEVTHVDLMDYVSKLFRRVYSNSHIRMVEHQPALWGYLYEWTDRHESTHALNRLRQMVERLHTQKFKRVIRETAPDAILCTHFLPAQLLDRMQRKGRIHQPVWVQVTDFDVHLLWIYPNLHGYFAASAEVAARMRYRGIPGERIHVTGIPVMPAFRAALDREACRAELSLAAGRPTVLLMAGGAGMGKLDELTEKILELREDLQLISIAGRNQQLLARLEQLKSRFGSRLCPLGFTTTIERVMAAADIAVTKPGGLTSSECLAMHLPMVLISPIPGQEERNADYLMEHGAAWKAHDMPGLLYRIDSLIDAPAQIQRMRDNAAAVATAGAAEDVINTIVNTESPA